MELRCAVLVIVRMLMRVRTGRAHRMHIPIENPERCETARDPGECRGPVPELGHLRQHKQRRHAHQHAAAERNRFSRKRVHRAQPHAASGREGGDQSNKERRGEQRNLLSSFFAALLRDFCAEQFRFRADASDDGRFDFDLTAFKASATISFDVLSGVRDALFYRRK